jgi:methylmalonyl-CoA mutase, C-terminal domain
MLRLAQSCCEAGFEVVYTDLNDPEAIAACAIQETVDHIGITTLPGTRVEDFARLFEILARENYSQVRVTAGGFFPKEDVERIKKLGVIDFYPKSSIYEKIEKWSEEYGGMTDQTECAKYEPKGKA